MQKLKRYINKNGNIDYLPEGSKLPEGARWDNTPSKPAAASPDANPTKTVMQKLADAEEFIANAPSKISQAVEDAYWAPTEVMHAGLKKLGFSDQSAADVLRVRSLDEYVRDLQNRYKQQPDTFMMRLRNVFGNTPLRPLVLAADYGIPNTMRRVAYLTTAVGLMGYHGVKNAYKVGKALTGFVVDAFKNRPKQQMSLRLSRVRKASVPGEVLLAKRLESAKQPDLYRILFQMAQGFADDLHGAIEVADKAYLEATKAGVKLSFPKKEPLQLALYRWKRKDGKGYAEGYKLPAHAKKSGAFEEIKSKGKAATTKPVSTASRDAATVTTTTKPKTEPSLSEKVDQLARDVKTSNDERGAIQQWLKSGGEFPKITRRTPAKGTPEREELESRWKKMIADNDAASELSNAAYSEWKKAKPYSKAEQRLRKKYEQVRDSYQPDPEFDSVAKAGRKAMYEDLLDSPNIIDKAYALFQTGRLDYTQAKELLRKAHTDEGARLGLKGEELNEFVKEYDMGTDLTSPPYKANDKSFWASRVQTFKRINTARKATDTAKKLGIDIEFSKYDEPEETEQRLAAAIARKKQKDADEQAAISNAEKARRKAAERVEFTPGFTPKKVTPVALAKLANQMGRYSPGRTLIETGFVTDGKLMVKPLDKERDAILAKIERHEGRAAGIGDAVKSLEKAGVDEGELLGVASMPDEYTDDIVMFRANGKKPKQYIYPSRHVSAVMSRYPDAKAYINKNGFALFKVGREIVGAITNIPNDDADYYKVKQPYQASCVRTKRGLAWRLSMGAEVKRVGGSDDGAVFESDCLSLGRKWVPVLKTKWINGKPVEFEERVPWDVTPEVMREIERNFREFQKHRIPSHIVWNHSGDARDQITDIAQLSFNGRVLKARWKVKNPNDIAELEKCPRYCSVEVYPTFEDGHGRKFRHALTHVGIVMHPVDGGGTVVRRLK